MKYLIVGLGNMGPDYEGTRHNVGFDVVNAFAHSHEWEWGNDKYGDIASGRLKGRQLYVLKPSLFMNRSGKSVSFWMRKLQVADNHLLVIHDEIHLDLGIVRMRKSGSAAGHNGVQDIIEKLGTNKFARLKVGVGAEFSKGRQVDYVLGHWTASEKDKLIEIIPHCVRMVDSFVLAGPDRTRNDFNKRVIS